MTAVGRDLLAVLSYDVLEHVPNYQRALAEFYRILKPDGVLLLSVPFTFTKDNLIRATIDSNGKISHFLQPKYHGDPLPSSGVLCYQAFGAELSDDQEQKPSVFSLTNHKHPGVIPGLISKTAEQRARYAIGWNLLQGDDPENRHTV